MGGVQLLGRRPDHNPSTGEVITQVAEADAADVEHGGRGVGQRLKSLRGGRFRRRALRGLMNKLAGP